ncbi:MAG TPA: VapC toxin family PIN domain ribonuclease [Cyanobacteria bacterium UBA11369]|nr:VapC toxin family PIN domain ribonuclease [Cyanobacteria bacterium UBA11371]HBE31995.1 VapC toxin family PIN domain ribonuclease [Cyanobacteria bacterium UBA11368]HBE51607.1 VapC toxin family PIN domain ribonuclease [Cyanobacteria bacterium UBA11369]
MGQLTIPSSATVYLDTSVIIYTVEANTNYYSILQPLWLKFQTGEIELITSELTLMEALVLPLKNANTALVSDYEQLLLYSEIQLVPITQSVLRNAANLRATTNLKTPDAIHAATSLSEDCTLFLTNDSGFRNVPNLSVVILSEVLAS